MADETISTLAVKLALDDGSFSQGMKNLKTSMGVIDSGFKSSIAGIKNWGTSLDGLKANATALGEKISLQQQIVAKYQEQLDKSKTSLAENSQKMIDAKSKVETLRAAYEQNVSTLGKNATETKQLKDELTKAESAFKSTETVVRNNSNSINGYVIQLNNAKGALNKMDLALTENNAKMKSSETATSKLKSGFLGLANQSKNSSTSIIGHFSSLKSAIFGFATTALAGLSIKTFVEAAATGEKTMAQMEAVLKSTGGAAGMTKEQLNELASAQSKVTTFSAGTTKQAENMLLTFTNIKSSVFPQTIKATEDMATAMKMNATDAAKTLGKALNDPAAGLSKLTKQGVTFTDAQKKQIKAMQEAGNTAGAQKIILQELEKEFGRSAVAAGKTFTGQLQIMNNNLKGAGATIATALMPIITNVMPSFVKGVQSIAAAVTSHKSEIQNTASEIGKAVKTALDFIINNGDLVKTLLAGIAGAIIAFKVAALAATIAQLGLNVAMDANPIGAIILAVEALVVAIGISVGLIMANWSKISAFFVNLWNGIKNAFFGFWNWLKPFIAQWYPEILGILSGGVLLIPALIVQNWSTISAFFVNLWNGIQSIAVASWNAITSGVMAIVTPLVNGIIALWNSVKDGISSILDGLKNIFSGAWELIKNIVLAPVLLICDLVTGNFTKLGSDMSHIFENIQNAIQQIWSGIQEYFSGIFQVISGIFATAWNGLYSIVTTLSANIKNGIVTAWNATIEFFKSLPNTLYNLGVNMINGLHNGVNSVIGNVSTAIQSGLNSAIEWIKQLPTEALQWGKDIINGIASGIKSAAKAVKDAVNGVAQDIRKFLHFSVPDEGPLKDFDTYMPDMVNLMVSGINKNKSKVIAALQSMASDMSLSISGAGIGSGYNNTTNQTSNSNVTYNLYQTNNNSLTDSVDAEIFGNSSGRAFQLAQLSF